MNLYLTIFAIFCIIFLTSMIPLYFVGVTTVASRHKTGEKSHNSNFDLLYSFVATSIFFLLFVIPIAFVFLPKFFEITLVLFAPLFAILTFFTLWLFYEWLLRKMARKQEPDISFDYFPFWDVE